jgi:hypothetical protein
MMGSVIDTGGASLGVMVAAGGLSGAAGGIVQRMIGGQSNSATAVAADAAGGAAGVMVGASVGAVVQGQPAQANFSAASGASKSVGEMADDLSGQLGKNSVSFRTPNKVGHIDLKGKAHGGVPTPHVQERALHTGPNGRTNLGRQTTRPATKQDIRTARVLEDRRGS